MCRCRVRGVYWFQSLLWWIYHFDMTDFWDNLVDPRFNPCYDGFIILISHAFLILIIQSRVSILVMMDLSFWCNPWPVYKHTAPRFQSLLWWIYHFDFLWRLILANVQCFNPCYDGFIILIARTRHEKDIGQLFQSLLWWIYHFDEDIMYILEHGTCRFNPCYDGFIILILSGVRHSGTSAKVSILVMMDLSFW